MTQLKKYISADTMEKLVKTFEAPAEPTSTSKAPQDEFNSFGELVAHRLRKIAPKVAESRMGQISSIIFQPINVQPDKSYFNMDWNSWI